MKLLVLAQIPPPLHGQSAMVRALVEGLPVRGIPVRHVNLRLSRDAADIGRWRLGKVAATLRGACQAIAAQYRENCDTLYYVPAPPEKRGALYRDWLLLALCRPFFSRLILHWHAPGLGQWLRVHASPLERRITGWLLGRADPAIVLAETLRDDAARFSPRQIAVVANGIADPGMLPPPPIAGPVQLLFLGLCSEEKGLFSAINAVIEANRRARPHSADPAFVLTAAGPFERPRAAARLAELQAQHPACLRHAGVVGDEEKRRLFTASHALLFPTRYAAEGMPLVALEALAHDRPVIATHWRALPEIITPDVGRLVPPGDADALVNALLEFRAVRPATGACRARFLARYTLDQHLTRLAEALRASAPPPPAQIPVETKSSPA